MKKFLLLSMVAVAGLTNAMEREEKTIEQTREARAMVIAELEREYLARLSPDERIKFEAERKELQKKISEATPEEVRRMREEAKRTGAELIEKSAKLAMEREKRSAVPPYEPTEEKAAIVERYMAHMSPEKKSEFLEERRKYREKLAAATPEELKQMLKEGRSKEEIAQAYREGKSPEKPS